MNPEKIINHLGEENKASYKNAVVPPIFQTSNFVFDNVQHMKHCLENEFSEHTYTRGNNPTVQILRQKLAALDNAEDALVFSSGSAAAAAAIFSVVRKGDHVICVKSSYGWTKQILTDVLGNLGVTTTFVDGSSIQNFENALQGNTRLIYLESPNSILMQLQDLNAVSQLAKANNIQTIIDNTYCAPFYQKPLDLGIDIVIYSASKYISGHSDVVAGVLCSSHKRIKAIFKREFMGFGAQISPNDAWLMIRSLRTLPIRLQQIEANTKSVVTFLENHPKVEQVFYPHSTQHPQYDLAKKQMTGCGGLFSFTVNMNTSEIEDFCNALNYFALAISWGGHESLVLPTFILQDKEIVKENAYPDNLIRMYVGLDNPEDLIEDIEQAFQKTEKHD